MPAAKTNTAQRRPRDAAATQAEILKAAKILFTQFGYAQCNLRQIAARAGVDVALVNRYFGSKRGLFAAIFDKDDFSFEPLMAQGKAKFALALARDAALKAKSHDEFDPLIIAIRSASSPDALEILHEMLECKMTGPLAKYLGGKDAHLRANFIIAWLVGFDLMRNVFRAKAFAGNDAEKMLRQLEKTFNSLV
jgi:AcrR family transcriptional regulator